MILRVTLDIFKILVLYNRSQSYNIIKEEIVCVHIKRVVEWAEGPWGRQRGVGW